MTRYQRPTAANQVFVFGSNLAGRHGRGAALDAKLNWGAKYGVGEGPWGQSYAIPTKDADLRPLPLDAIERFVTKFLVYACAHPELTFLVTRVGCGLAGYTDAQLAPFFTQAPDNCQLPAAWEPYRAART